MRCHDLAGTSTHRQAAEVLAILIKHRGGQHVGLPQHLAAQAMEAGGLAATRPSGLRQRTQRARSRARRTTVPAPGARAQPGAATREAAGCCGLCASPGARSAFTPAARCRPWSTCSGSAAPVAAWAGVQAGSLGVGRRNPGRGRSGWGAGDAGARACALTPCALVSSGPRWLLYRKSLTPSKSAMVAAARRGRVGAARRGRVGVPRRGGRGPGRAASAATSARLHPNGARHTPEPTRERASSRKERYRPCPGPRARRGSPVGRGRRERTCVRGCGGCSAVWVLVFDAGIV